MIVISFRAFAAVAPAGRAINTAETATELDVQRAISRGLQSFSILMNFGHDGTTSLQIIGSNSVYWADFGYCKRIIYLLLFLIFFKLSIF
jgi:hypothetical protein